MEWINFRHLYAFWSVCRHGGFQKAANKVFVSQSAISDQVAQLEIYFEEKLIDRSTRSLQVTPRGVELLKYADEIFAKSTAINQIFKDKKAFDRPDRIRIGMVGGISRNFIYNLIQPRLEAASTRIDIIDGSIDELTQLLKSFEVDLVFSLDIPRKKDLMQLSYRKVGSSPLCIAGKPELVKRLKSGKRKPTNLQFFIFNHPFEEDQLKKSLAAIYSEPIKPVVSTDDISLLRFLANSGDGLAITPQIGVREDLSAKLLAQVAIKNLPPVDFNAIYLKNGLHRTAIDNFLNGH